MSSTLRRPCKRARGREHVARAASILFHPAVVMTAAALVATQGREDTSILPVVAFTLLAAAAVMAYSARQVRKGRWSHIDASLPQERSQLNRFSSWLLLALAAVLAVAGASPGLAAALGLSGLIVLAGHLLRGRLKSSLHVAFAIFATFIAWPEPTAVVVLAGVVLVVGWSRLALRRHGVADVLAGAVTGALAGLAFRGFLLAGWLSA